MLIVLIIAVLMVLISIWLGLPLPIRIRRIIIKAAICVLILLITSILAFRVIRGFYPIPFELRNLAHLVFPPKDLYQPIVTDKFQFATKGFSKTYNLYPRYFELYELGFLPPQTGIDSHYEFRGKLKVEFFQKIICFLTT